MQNSNMDEKNRVTDRENFLTYKKRQKNWKNAVFKIASGHSVHIQQNLITIKPQIFNFGTMLSITIYYMGVRVIAVG